MTIVTVRELMTHPVISLGEGDSLERAAELMRVANVRHLPVLRDGLLVGVNVEGATLGLDGDVRVVAEGMDCCSELRGFIGSTVGAGGTFGGLHVPLDRRLSFKRCGRASPPSAGDSR